MVVYGAALCASLIDDPFLTRVVAASIAGGAIEVILTWDLIRKDTDA